MSVSQENLKIVCSATIAVPCLKKGWQGRKTENCYLAEKSGFQVFLTLDRGIEYQQNLAGRRIAIILIRARSCQLRDLLPHSSEILKALETIEPGGLAKIGRN
jgi:hypothetical protein